MKKGFFFSLLTVACISMGIVWQAGGFDFEQEKKVKNKSFSEEGEASENTPGRHAIMSAARIKYEYDMLKDPATGKIPKNIYAAEMRQAMSLPVSLDPRSVRNGVVRTANGVTTPTSNVYLPAGPNNYAGRTRTLVFDKRYNGTTNRVILSGGVSGGIMRSADGGQTWTLVTPSQQIHSLTALAQDTRTGSENIWYAGTGERGVSNSASAIGAFFYGNGVFKSTDNGVTWSPLTSTQSTLESFNSAFDLIDKIVVHPVTGDVYVAGQNTIQRSQNGGTSWTAVKGTLGGNVLTGNTDIVITSNGSKMYASFHLRNSFGTGGTSTDRGVWESTSGDAGSWTAIAGQVANTPEGFKQNLQTESSVSSFWGRVVLQLAPSNNNILYVLYENGLEQASPNFSPEVDLFKYEIIGSTGTWTNLSSNMPVGTSVITTGLNVQNAYNMTLAVKPNDPNMVFVGGTNIFRSTNGFANTSNSKMIGGYLNDGSHPDMHGLVFDPTNSNRAYLINDGGIHITQDITATTVAWLNAPNYRTIQYYFVSLDPETGKNNFIGGAQDNGTWYRDASLNLGARPIYRPGVDDYEPLFGGDGVAVDIAKINAGQQFMYYGTYSGALNRDELLDYANYPGGRIRPRVSELIGDGTGSGWGDFVTYYKLSNANSEVLFYANFYNLFRTTAAKSVDSTNWTKMTGVEIATNTGSSTPVSIKTMDFSWGPYTTSHVMYYGTSGGRVFRLNDYANAPALTIPVDISPAGITGNVIDIAVNPNDDNEIMVVVSNYGVNSIWWCWNAKSATPSWSNVEGNLTLPSIRSCAIVVKKEGGLPVTEYYVGTSVGLYTTAKIGTTMGTGGSGSVVWSREGASVLNFAVVSSLDYRPEDNTLLIGTHGNGMFYTVIGSPNFTPNVATAVAAPIVNDKNFVKVYPTVGTGYYQYGQGTITGIRMMQIQVYNMAGQAVYQSMVNYGSGNIPLTHLPAGTYVVQITSDNKKYQTLQKVIKQ